MGKEAIEFGKAATNEAVAQNIKVKFGSASSFVNSRVFLLFVVLAFTDVFLVGYGYHTYVTGRTSLGIVCAEPANIRLDQNATTFDGFKSNSNDGCPLLNNAKGLDNILCPPEGCKIHIGISSTNLDVLDSIQKTARGILIVSAVLEFGLLLVSSPFSQPIIVSQVLSAVLAILVVVFEFFRDYSDYTTDIAVASLWLRVIRTFFTLASVVFLYVEVFSSGAVSFLQRLRESFKEKDFRQSGRLPASEMINLMKDLAPEGYSEASLRKASAQLLTKLDPRRTEFVSYSSCMAGCIDLVIPAIDEDEIEAIMGGSLNQPLLGGGRPWTREEDNELRTLRSKKEKGNPLSVEERDRFHSLNVGYEKFNEQGARLMGSPSVSPTPEMRVDIPQSVSPLKLRADSPPPTSTVLSPQLGGPSPQLSTYSDFLGDGRNSRMVDSPPSYPPLAPETNATPNKSPQMWEGSPQLTTYSGFIGNPIESGSPQVDPNAQLNDEETLAGSDVWQLKLCKCGAKFRMKSGEAEPECPSCMGFESIKKKSAMKLQICGTCGLRYKSETTDDSDCPICASPTDMSSSQHTILKSCTTCGLRYRSSSKSSAQNECPGCGFVTVRSPSSPDALRSVPDCLRTATPTSPTSPNSRMQTFKCKGCGHLQTRSVSNLKQVVACKSCFMTCNLSDSQVRKDILDSPRIGSPSPESLKWISPTSSYNYNDPKQVPDSIATPAVSEDLGNDWCLVSCKGCGDPLKYRSDPTTTENRIIRCPTCSVTRLVSPTKQVAFESDSWVLFKCGGCLSLMKKKGSQSKVRCSNCGQLQEAESPKTSISRQDGAASPLYMPPIDVNAL